VIKCGDPFVLYIPFKRSNKLKHIVRYQTEKDKKLFKKGMFAINNSFRPNGGYREMQRKRDSKK
jgi:tRNA (Thr-GGU) A37 N-methylase